MSNDNAKQSNHSHKLPRFRNLLDEKQQNPNFAAIYEETLSEVRLGLALCELREAKDITLQELESRTGISHETLSRIERGRIPALPTLQKIAKALHARIVLHPDETISVEAAEELSKAA